MNFDMFIRKDVKTISDKLMYISNDVHKITPSVIIMNDWNVKTIYLMNYQNSIKVPKVV